MWFYIIAPVCVRILNIRALGYAWDINAELHVPSWPCYRWTSKLGTACKVHRWCKLQCNVCCMCL